MKIISYLIFIAIISCISSCGNSRKSDYYNEEGLIVHHIYSPDDELIQRCTYNKDSIPNGICEFFSKEGVLTSLAHYSEGKLHGINKDYFDNGKIKAIINYNGGLLEGDCIYYHSNGQIEQTGYFVNNLFHGLYKYYDSMGIIIADAIYQKGLKKGKSHEYYEDGSIKNYNFYRADTLVYSRNYKDNESLTYEYPILNITIENNEIKRGDTLKVSVIPVPDIPKMYPEIILTNVLDPEKEEYDTPTYYSSINGDTLKYKRIYNKKGEYQLGLVIFHIDSITGEKLDAFILDNDSLKINVW